MILNFVFVALVFSDSLTTRMNVGETIFRRMEQVNFFLKVSFLVRRNKNTINRFIPLQESIGLNP